MRKLCLLMLIAFFTQAGRTEEVKTPETAEQKVTEKVREIDSHTGYPIYEEGEPYPEGVWVHIRRKDGSYIGPDDSKTAEVTAAAVPQSQIAVETKTAKSETESAKALSGWLEKQAEDNSKRETKIEPEPKKVEVVKVREILPSTGKPIYEDGEEIPPGVNAHVRLKDGTLKGATSDSTNSTVAVETETSSPRRAMSTAKFEMSRTYQKPFT